MVVPFGMRSVVGDHALNKVSLLTLITTFRTGGVFYGMLHMFYDLSYGLYNVYRLELGEETWLAL